MVITTRDVIAMIEIMVGLWKGLFSVMNYTCENVNLFHIYHYITDF